MNSKVFFSQFHYTDCTAAAIAIIENIYCIYKYMYIFDYILT